MLEREYRKSSYIIFVKVKKDTFILLHGYSGAIDVLCSDIANKLMNNNVLKEDMFDVSDFQKLRKRGYITTLSEKEEREYVRRFAVALHKKDRLLCSFFTFVITYNCNFRCPYCFEQSTVNKILRKQTMSYDCVDKAFCVMEDLQKGKLTRSKNIALFGGEPLLKENFQLINYIVEKGIKNGYKFFAVTNGYDLDSFEPLLAPDKIFSVQITIDGMENLHDSKRIHYQGFPTFF